MALSPEVQEAACARSSLLRRLFAQMQTRNLKRRAVPWVYMGDMDGGTRPKRKKCSPSRELRTKASAWRAG